MSRSTWITSECSCSFAWPVAQRCCQRIDDCMNLSGEELGVHYLYSAKTSTFDSSINGCCRRVENGSSIRMSYTRIRLSPEGFNTFLSDYTSPSISNSFSALQNEVTDQNMAHDASASSSSTRFTMSEQHDCIDTLYDNCPDVFLLSKFYPSSIPLIHQICQSKSMTVSTCDAAIVQRHFRF